MSRFLLLLVAALAPLAAAAQTASRSQVDTVSSVAECLAVGLPSQWKVLRVVVELPEPYAESGAVRYQVTLLDDRDEPFTPCDPRLPPAKLVELRDSQPTSERGWNMVILTMKPDASFDLKYRYPEVKK
jgi:hypothetical protein